jgi:hypothetical protein
MNCCRCSPLHAPLSRLRGPTLGIRGGGGDAQPQLLGLSPRRTPSDHIWLSAPSLPRAPHSRPPPLGYLQEKGYSALIKIAFQRMTLMCDAALLPDHLQLRISMLGQFGRQADTNITLTAVESLFWGVSDTVQVKRHELDHKPTYGALWMHPPRILCLCDNPCPEVVWCYA